MPAAIPLLVNAGMAYAGYSAAAVAVATLATTVVVGQYERGRAERKSRNEYNKNLADRLTTIRSGVATRKYIIGTVRTGGALMYAESIGPNQTAFDSIVAFAANECSILGYYLNDEYVPVGDFPGAKYGQRDRIHTFETFVEAPTAGVRERTLAHAPIAGSVSVWIPATGDSGAAGLASTVDGSKVSYTWPGGAGSAEISYDYWGPSKLLVQFKDGDADQVSTDWSGYSSPAWTASHRLRGVCHARTLMIWDENIYQQGAPQVGAVLKGGPHPEHPFYDPRDESTPAYTDNPAILAGWWMTLPREDGGCGIPSDWIDWDSVKVAANICDELITVRTLDGTGYEQIKRYQCHGILDTADDPISNLESICSAMAARKPVRTAGKYRMHAGAFRSSTLTITDDMVIGTEPISVVKTADGAPPNVCTATLADATKNWQEASPPVVQNDTYILEDGRQEAIDLPLHMTTDPRQANYLMGVEIERRRPAFTCMLHVNGVGEDLALGDTLDIGLTNRPQYTGKTFEIVEITDKWNGTFDLKLAEIKSNSWALDADRFVPIVQPAPPDTSHLWTVAEITGFSASFGTPQLFPDGTSVSAVTLAWDLHSQSYVRGSGRIELRYRQVGTDLWRGIPEAPGDATGTVFSAALIDTAAYEFQARARNGVGALGPWVSTFEIVDGEAVVTPSLRIRSSGLVFQVNASGVGSPASITLEPVFGGPITGPVTWTIVSGAATLVDAGSDVRTLAFADMIGDLVTIRASATYGSVAYTDTVSVLKVYDGLPGPAGTAKLLQLTATSQVFKVDTLGAGTPSAIAFTAAGQNLSGSPSFSITGGTLSGTGNTRTLAFANMSAASATVECTWDGQTDTITVVKVFDGTPGADGSDGSDGSDGAPGSPGADGLSAITPVVSNQSHTVPANAAGTVSSYAGSGTTIRVYEGSTLLTFHTTLAAGRFIIGSPTPSPVGGITVGSRSGSGTTTATVAQHASMTQDTVTITYPVTVRRANGTDVSLSLVQTITKSKAGTAGTNGQDGSDGQDGADGADAIVPILTNDLIVLPANASGAVTSYANATTTLAIWNGTVDDSANWSFTRVNGPGVTTSTLAGNVLTVSAVQSGTDETYVTITATRSGYSSVTKRVRIVKAKQGAKGDTGNTGATGPRGTVQIAHGISGSTWSDATATSAINAAGYGTPVNRDVVTLYSTTTNWSEARAYVSGAWIPLAAYINGSLIVQGTVLAEHLDVDSLSAISAVLGNVSGGAFYGGSFGPSYAWPNPNSGGFHLSASGLLLGNFNGATGDYAYIGANGSAGFTNIYARGDIHATSLTSNIVTTGHIQANNITLPATASSGVVDAPSGSWATLCSFSMNTVGYPLFLTGSGWIENLGSLEIYPYFRLFRSDGATLRQIQVPVLPFKLGFFALSYAAASPGGNYGYYLQAQSTNGITTRTHHSTLFGIEAKR